MTNFSYFNTEGNQYVIVHKNHGNVVCSVGSSYRNLVLAALRMFEKMPEEEQKRALLQETLDR